MKYIIILCILIAIYYQIYKRFQKIITKTSFIFYCICSMLFITLLFFIFSKKFVYNVLKSVKDVDERPLYDKNSIVYKQNQMDGLRYNLAMRQGWRCIHCQNPILPKDIYDYKIHYIKPLQFGGANII